MYFVVSAGGTAGHINPALAVADELRRQGHEILFVGTPDHIEAKLAVEAGFDFLGLEVSGFDKAHPTSMFSSLNKIEKAKGRVVEGFKQRRPDAVLGFGAYVALPVGMAAVKMHIPLIIHEQNSVPGMANKQLAKKADLVALTYEGSASQLSCKNKPIVIGNPVRAAFETSTREAGRELLGIPQDATLLLVMGGSLGARHLNAALCAMKDELLAIDNLYIVQSTGARDYDNVIDMLQLDEQQAQRWHVSEYIDCMGDVLAATDLVVSRAGASSLAEIMTMATPAILVPYPHARGDHQTLNARSCVEAGAAELVADKDVDTPHFKELVLGLIQDPQKRAAMAQACRSLSGSQARKRLAQAAIDLGEKG